MERIAQPEDGASSELHHWKVYYMCFVVLVINIGSTMLPSINERASAKKMKTFTN